MTKGSQNYNTLSPKWQKDVPQPDGSCLANASVLENVVIS